MNKSEFPNAKNLSKGPRSPEMVWGTIRDVVTRALDDLYHTIHTHDEQPSDSERADRMERIYTNEEIFFSKVVEAVNAAHQACGSVSVLFDVDETIGVNVYGTDGVQKTILRPSLMPLLDYLKTAHSCSIGLFTSRRDLESQVKDPLMLGALEPYLAPHLVFSTRGHDTSRDSHSFAENLQHDFGGEGGIVDDNKIALNPSDRPRSSGDMEKLNCLRAIREQLPQGAIVIIDDMEYPAILNQRAGFYGVYLDWRKSDSGAFIL